jgi:hypothetical protein
MKTPEFARLNSLAQTRGGIDETHLQPFIDMCLEPLPIAKATVQDKPRKDVVTKATKAVAEDEGLNEAFKDEVTEDKVQKMGKMPTTFKAE